MGRIDLGERLTSVRERLDDEAPGEAVEVPLFATFARKEARVRDDQLDALAALSKMLMRCRRVKGERITDNALIRVAIDLLLALQDALSGATEAELRESVTSQLPTHRADVTRKSRALEVREP